MNRVIISGNLGQKPEVRQANSGISVCNFGVATNERVKKGDEWEDHTEWHNIVVFGKQGENCEKYLDKGSRVVIEGKIRTKSWEDKEGNTRKKTEIIANNVEFGERPANGAGQQQARPEPSSGFDGNDGIPF